MNEELLEAMIEQWEPIGAEVVRTIDSDPRVVERIVKRPQELYSLYRYFMLGVDMVDGSATARCEVSVDLADVDADTIIQHLAERL